MGNVSLIVREMDDMIKTACFYIHQGGTLEFFTDRCPQVTFLGLRFVEKLVFLGQSFYSLLF